jgi:CheY-like chemotaxis protein
VQPLIEAAGQSLLWTGRPSRSCFSPIPTGLSQVFANLLSNASKFSEPGSAITMRIAPAEDGIEVAVSDQGIGIAPEKQREIFEMFTQGDSSLERAQGGLGIGLSLARRLAEMHGGQLHARSDGPGRAANSPCACRCPRARTSASRAERSRAGRRSDEAPLRVMVVDDNRDSADMLALSLKLMGHEVLTLYDPLDVVAAARTGSRSWPSSTSACRCSTASAWPSSLRAQDWPDGRGPRLVALTGWGQEEDRRRSEEAGFDEHLVKPADLETIERVCQDAVEILGAARADAIERALAGGCAAGGGGSACATTCAARSRRCAWRCSCCAPAASRPRARGSAAGARPPARAAARRRSRTSAT